MKYAARPLPSGITGFNQDCFVSFCNSSVCKKQF